MSRPSRETNRLKCVEMPVAVCPTSDELAEFERLDATAPLDAEGQPAWSFEGEPLTARERRWLELYRKLKNGKDSAKANGRRR